MATNTTNYNLIKPDVDDFYDVNQFNQNADIIDSQLKNNADSIEAIRINDLTALPPVEVTLNKGESTHTAEHDSTARVIALEGDDIINYVPPFDSGLLTKNSVSVIEAPNKFRAKSTNAFGYCGGFKIPLKPNTTYMLAMDIEAIKGNDYFFIRSNEDDTNLLSGSYQGYASDGLTFTTKSDTSYIHLIFSVNANDSEIVFSNVRIVEGTEMKPFVLGIQGITNPTINNTITGDSITLLGTFHEGDVVSEDKGQYSVLKAKKEGVFDGNEEWGLYKTVNNTNYKAIRTRLYNAKTQDCITVKYNGSILKVDGSLGSVDVAAIDFTNNWFYMTVSNTDSGWGTNYNPTPEEIQAFIKGWRMYLRYDANLAPYDGTGEKAWISLDGNESTATIPTTQAPIDPKWKPYKLLFDLASPIREPIEAINSVLKLEKGDNVLQVSEGRIVREVVKPYYSPTTKTSYINARNTPLASAGWTSVWTNNIKQVYVDGKPVDWYIGHEVNNGVPYSYAAIEAKVDETTQFSVDYEPLYPFEVTAPINNITIKYQPNLGSVLSQTVEDVVNLTDRTNDIEMNMVRKGEGLKWFPITLIGGAINEDSGTPSAYTKDTTGNVHVKMRFVHKSSVNGTSVGRLPAGFRPGKMGVTIQATAKNTGAPVYMVIDTFGWIYVYNTNVNNYTLQFYMIFKVGN